MKSLAFGIVVLCFPVLMTASSPFAGEQLRALIIDGQNNHSDWPKTTMMMKQYLEQTGRFSVDIARTRFTWNGGELLAAFPLENGGDFQPTDQPRPDPEFKPKFSRYDVVISNFGFNAAPWPESTRESFVEFVRGGGGLVIVHAANNSFGDWMEYNRMIGLGGWGGRNAMSGPFVYLDDNGKTIRDESAGAAGGHGPQHGFQIVLRDRDHPITRGLPGSWMHSKDELYQNLRGPAENLTVLATAHASRKFEGSGRHEPMIMTVSYGKGRIYHTPMGHADYSMECVGFITTLQRGAEWAATGKVSLTEIPKDFPRRDKESTRGFEWKAGK